MFFFSGIYLHKYIYGYLASNISVLILMVRLFIIYWHDRIFALLLACFGRLCNHHSGSGISVLSLAGFEAGC